MHTGAYADDVFAEVEAYNTANYRDFSTLVRSIFDDAARHFESESIDILHIDGVHTYEAVLHDFETWWPKVRPGGAVLMHDSAERTHDFGIWRVVQELRQRFAVAEFGHSHGLAVILKPGGHELSGVLALLFNSDEAHASSVKRYYEIFADHLNYCVYSERQCNPAFDIVSQLFWRRQGEAFSEAASIRSSNVIGTQPARVSLPIPTEASSLNQLQVLVSHTAAPLKLHSVEFLDRAGGSVLRYEAGPNITALRAAGLQCWRPDSDSAVLLTGVPERGSFVIDKDLFGRSSLDRLGTVVLEISALDPMSFVGAISRIADRELLQQQKQKVPDSLASYLLTWFRSSRN